ncbi:MAG: protein-disulfide reductase DsbD family protein [Bacteroidota bacterium]|jgi:thiol:disulfide interchange protein
MRKLFGCFILFFGWTTQLLAQTGVDTAITWKLAAQRSSDSTVVLTIQAKPEKGLAIFGLYAGSSLGGNIQIDSLSRPLSSNDIQLIAGAGKEIQLPDDTTVYRIYTDSATWSVTVKLPANQQGWITGSINWLGKKEDAFPSDTYAFRVAIPAIETAATSSGGWWQIFLICFLTGLFAVITPCVFPLIPVTVSYFLKKSETREAGWRNALWYSLSIVLIYTIPTLLLTLIFGDSILYRISVSPVSNLLFFLIFLLFAISFFGAFEISLPNSWANKADKRAGKGGLGGIFFMALTLVIVSFSCTGPLVGTLLGQTSSNGVGIAPVLGMFGFGLGLALPFSLLAFFPALLPALPKSGSWLNAVKVCFGFIELALALKFLSNVDLSYHWGILDRDVFLVLWIVIFGLMSLYLLGKIRFSHDSELKYLTVPRFFLALLSLSFTIYMIPGLWGAPLNALSGFIPPAVTQDFNLNNIQYQTSVAAPGTNLAKPPIKYTDKLKVPFGLTAYFDLEEGMAAARLLKKPVMLDFTGHTCANCRKMEEQVWKQPEILSRIKQDFVLISLFVDESARLPVEEQFKTPDGDMVTTVGEKNLAYEKAKFGINAQPLYMFLDLKGEPLSDVKYGYDPDVSRFLAHLESVKQEFARRK